MQSSTEADRHFGRAAGDIDSIELRHSPNYQDFDLSTSTGEFAAVWAYQNEHNYQVLNTSGKITELELKLGFKFV